MVNKLGFETSTQLFNSIKPNMGAENSHKEWYMKIKRSIQINDSIMEALDKGLLDKKDVDEFQ